MNATEVMAVIRETGFRRNGYAEAYFRAMPRSERQYGEHGLKAQVLYFFNNVRAQGEEQKRVKKKLIKWAQSRS